MRIVHTADWHMGLRLGHVDRTADLTRAIAQVADVCRRESADCLLICGDLFDGTTRADVVRYWTGILGEQFADFLTAGGTILAVTGNHDNDHLAQTLRHSLALADPAPVRPGERLRPGRFHLFAEPTFCQLADHDGTDVQFVMMPCPSAARYDLGDAPANGPDRGRALLAAFRRTLAGMRDRPGYDRGRPTVLAAHIPTAGAEIRAGVSYADAARADAGDVLADADLPADYAYVALGDIHRPQAIRGLDHVRYSGSIDRMDLGESADDKSVVVVDVRPGGLAGPVRLVPLDATPIYQVTINDPQAQLPTLADLCPDREVALVRLVVRYRVGRDHLLDIIGELEGLFPRWYERVCTEVSADAPDGPAAAEPSAARTPADTVRAYLSDRLADHADRAAVLNLAEELLAEQP